MCGLRRCDIKCGRWRQSRLGPCPNATRRWSWRLHPRWPDAEALDGVNSGEQIAGDGTAGGADYLESLLVGWQSTEAGLSTAKQPLGRPDAGRGRAAESALDTRGGQKTKANIRTGYMRQLRG